ncbi:MBL fold metallo-hydrolase [Nocardioides sp.]|uniref:MBL fold metallo-hydrolase n=1 Tax=Nocardioides sp. TaxID=35761 RepID=UPI002724C332|nr:MBL fold metallo-hydrolase [Nocardioides sp.]MDO9457354.1 MBL fold metallo-hydrolase [Nocardioides sp.]
MRITKFGHACVRVEHAGVRIVLDPGSFTEREAVEGADVVLITHQHADHYDAGHLRATTAEIHTIGAVADVIRDEAPDLADRLHVVAPGDVLDVGVPIRVVGEKHAVIHPDYPRFDNSGYLLTLGSELVYHPGDSLTAPGERIDLLLAPVSAPWLKVGEAIDFVREVGAPRSLAIHDRVYSDVGLAMVETHMDNLALKDGMRFTRLADGADLD